MSPSWRDGLVIAVQPDEVRVRRHRRGWKRRADAPVRAAVGAAAAAAGRARSGAAVADACRQALDQALRGEPTRAFDAHVVLSNHLVRYAVVPRAIELRDPVEREAAARHAMAAIYGDMAAGWRVVLDASGASDDALAAAMDEDLHAGLTEQLKAAGARRVQVEPLFGLAVNRSSRWVTARTGWIAVVERGRVVLGSVADGELGAVRSHRVRKGIEEELPVLLEQASLIDGGDVRGSEVVVVTEDEALALPTAAEPFQFRPVRLDPTAPDRLNGPLT